MELNRRSFIQAAGATIAAGAFASVALADAPADQGAPQGAGGPGGPQGGPGGPGMTAAAAPMPEGYDWRAKPEEITDFVEEVDCDVVVVGKGFSGINAFRYLCEAGYQAILVEKSEEEYWMATGNEFASINGDAVLAYGAPEIDPVEYYQNWQRIHGNYCHPELVMKFCLNSAEASNHWLDQFTTEELAGMTSSFLPKTSNQLDELDGIKFWPSVASFYGSPNETEIGNRNCAAAIAAGGEIRYGYWAEYAIQDETGAICGFVAEGPDGYVKFNCRALVTACGGFGGNSAMMADMIRDMQMAKVDGETLSSMSANNGRGVQMAFWCGARLEYNTPGMNMKGLSVPGKMNCLPQATWIESTTGKRFANEFYPVAEQRGLQTVYTARTKKWAVCDDNFTQYRTYTIPQHAGFEATESNINSLRESLDKAYAQFKGTYEEPEKQEGMGFGGPMASNNFIADDTLEGLAAQMGLDEEATANFIQQIADVNEYAANGADLQFGRNAKVLFPVDTPPYYAVEFTPVLGETMVTCGGIITDGDQRALDKDYNPIPGLYCTGNDTARRFGVEYCTPTPGVSLGMAITLGRECGKSVAKFLG
ncbi:MAG: FAD-binding protein [Coriobacteriales bacterium]|nr:FAD-binding protein [Coriobacteriales bacterium]